MGRSRGHVIAACLLLGAAALAGSYRAVADSLYKYRGEDGEWIFTDRKPAADTDAEVRTMAASFVAPEFKVTHEFSGKHIQFIARNEFHLPIEASLEFVEITGLSIPDPDRELRWVVAPRQREVLMQLEVLEEADAPRIRYRFAYMPGDPSARHSPAAAYRAPFPAGMDFPISQAYPDAVTHQSPDSLFAVDIVMPVGTDVLAARDGVVFAVAADNFRSGLDAERDGPAANVVHILHDDGTFALYAHLNWNSIRVQPGDRVTAGQYIADSGNTGYSSGPHLHFAVQRNTGFSIESVPVEFKGSNASLVVPASGNVLTAYP